MNTGSVNAAAGVIHAAQQQGRTAAGIAMALESAQLLQSPETADELERLRLEAAGLRSQLALFNEWRAADGARMAELLAERHSTNEALSDAVEALREQRYRIAELEAQAKSSRGKAIADVGDFLNEHGQKDAAYIVNTVDIPAARDMERVPLEDPHDSPLHHRYALGRDMPQVGGAS